MFKYPVKKIINIRTSSRTYIQKRIETDKLEMLKKFISENRDCPFDSESRFEIVFAKGQNKDELKGLITYGFIKNAPAFIIGAIKNSPKNLEDFGYLMERIILFATDIGLGTCWLGGTFSKSNFSQKILLQDDELLPAIAAIGYKTEKIGTIDSIIRMIAGSKNRLPWENLFFEKKLGNVLPIKNAGSYVFALEMVRLGPSASNKQPWRILKEPQKNIFHFILERTKNYNRTQKIMNTADLQRIDMGIAMCHFELTAREKGLSGNWLIIKKGIENLSLDNEYIVSWVEDGASF